MQKKILITGATDGIGLDAARRLLQEGAYVLLHGRNPDKLEAVGATLGVDFGTDRVETYLADLARPGDILAMADAVIARHARLDVLINNAGVFKLPVAVTEDGFDVRFAVNFLAPVLLTERLLPLLGPGSRIVNLSSSIQAPVELEALGGERRLDTVSAYAQSKLALTMWSRQLAARLGDDGPTVVAVNPGSLLATKMIREACGARGNDVAVGSGVLVRAALSEAFADASGRYFDNDRGRFAQPHPDAQNPRKVENFVRAIHRIVPALRCCEARATPLPMVAHT